MAALADDSSVYPILLELADCLCAEVDPDGKMRFCGVLVGNQIPAEGIDDCDDCGLGYVRLGTGFPSTELFPQPDPGAATCTTIWAYQIYIGVVRCAPVGGSDGSPPHSDDIAEYSRQLLADMAAIRRAVKCCFMDKFEDANYAIGAYTPLPMEGGIGGGELLVTVQEFF